MASAFANAKWNAIHNIWQICTISLSTNSELGKNVSFQNFSQRGKFFETKIRIFFFQNQTYQLILQFRVDVSANQNERYFLKEL